MNDKELIQMVCNYDLQLVFTNAKDGHNVKEVKMLKV